MMIRLKRKNRLTPLIWTMIITLVVFIPQTASAIALKQTSIIESDMITLGDIFSGLKTNSDKILGAAPQPGQDMTLNARTLMRIAIALDLPWRPATTQDQITIRRAATIIEPAAIQDALKNAITAHGVNDTYTVILNAPPARIILPQNENKTLEVLHLDINPENQTFTAALAAPSKANPLKEFTVSGRIERMVEVPVLISTIQSGYIINPDDIKTLSMPVSEIGEDWILSQQDLLHMTPRRMIVAGKPLKRSEIEAPQIIGRGELVTMIFSINGLSLTAQGKALQNGAKGDIIRVVNASSNKTIQGMVTGAKEITVKNF